VGESPFQATLIEMNRAHRWLCRSGHWKRAVETQILPWVLEGIDLGPNVLEVGPGPGVTTDLLRTRTQNLTCVEIDSSLAASLKRRTARQNVTVLHEDATSMSLGDASFDAALSFTMLHHVPSAELQDRLLREIARVLRRGGVFAGTDSRYSFPFALLHLFDTMIPVDPHTFPERLRAAGFENIRVDLKPHTFRFRCNRS